MSKRFRASTGLATSADETANNTHKHTMKPILIKTTTCRVHISMFATEAELKKAEAKKTKLENAGYKLVYSDSCSLTYRLPC